MVTSHSMVMNTKTKEQKFVNLDVYITETIPNIAIQGIKNKKRGPKSPFFFEIRDIISILSSRMF
jgi:hypothetical protein